MSTLVPVQEALELGNEQMAHDVFDEIKAISVRPSHRDYTEGGVVVLYYQGEDVSAIALATIDVVRHCTIGEVTEDEWRADGFESQQDLLDGLNVFYNNSLTLDSAATVVRWSNLRGKQVEQYRRWKAEDAADLTAEQGVDPNYGPPRGGEGVDLSQYDWENADPMYGPPRG